jgi:hypothetical protein
MSSETHNDQELPTPDAMMDVLSPGYKLALAVLSDLG